MKQLETCPPVQAAEYVPVAGDFAQLEQADIATDTNYASQGYWKGVATHFVRNKRAMIGLILVLLMIFLAFVAPLFSGYAYDEIVTALNAKGTQEGRRRHQPAYTCHPRDGDGRTLRRHLCR